MDDWIKNIRLQPLSMDPEIVPEIKINLTESDASYTVRAQIPGAKKEDVKVHLDGNRVSISAETKQEKEEKEKEGERVIYSECSQGSSYRSLTLECDVDESKSQAKFENGVLVLTLPKKNMSTSKQIEIK
jgi:HSP20 family protein